MLGRVSVGTAVLVHGAWSNPADWRWVVEALPADLDAVAVDLPSHRRGDATRADDVAEVAAAVADSMPPVVVMGWSYGGAVLTDLPAASLGVRRLLYVASVPGVPPDDPATPAPDAPADLSHVLLGDGTAVLDNDWFLTSDPAVMTLPEDVVTHLRAHPRRPVSVTAILQPPQRAAWREVDTTVLIGASDDLVPAAQQVWVLANVQDTRLVNCDHFLIFREPRLLAAAILESLVS